MNLYGSTGVSSFSIFALIFFGSFLSLYRSTEISMLGDDVSTCYFPIFMIIFFDIFQRQSKYIWMQDACAIFNILMLVEPHETLGTLARPRYMLEGAPQLKALMTKIVPRFSVRYLITGHNTCSTLSCLSFKTN